MSIRVKRCLSSVNGSETCAAGGPRHTCRQRENARRAGFSATGERANYVTALQCAYTPSHIFASCGSIAILHNMYISRRVDTRPLMDLDSAGIISWSRRNLSSALSLSRTCIRLPPPPCASRSPGPPLRRDFRLDLRRGTPYRISPSFPRTQSPLVSRRPIEGSIKTDVFTVNAPAGG